MSGDGWIDPRERVPQDGRTVAALYRGNTGLLFVIGTRYHCGSGRWRSPGDMDWGGVTPLAWQDLALPVPPPCWPSPEARLAELRRELAEIATRRDEASNVALDCGMEIRRVEAEIARIEGGGR